MQIGDIVLPAVRDFDFDDGGKQTQHLASLGTTGFLAAEFTPEIPNVSFAGYLLKTFSGTRSLITLEEDFTALSERRVGYNYIHSVRGKRGYLSVGLVKKSPNNGNLWPISGTGKWYDYGTYTLKYSCRPSQMSQSLTIPTGNNWVAIPKGATYTGGDGVSNTVSTEDGNITLVRSNTSNVRFDLTAVDSANGEVRCYDGSSQVYLTSHMFTGNLTISNGLYKVTLSANTVTIYYWNGTGYTKIDDFTCGTFSKWWLSSSNPDAIIARTSSGIIVEVERGRVPHLYTPSAMTCTALTPSDASTSTGTNYLPIGTNLYVAGNSTFSITANVIGSGHHWVYYDSSGTQAQQGKDVLMVSNLKRIVVMR